MTERNKTLWKALLQRVEAGTGVGELQLVGNGEQDGTFIDSKEKQNALFFLCLF